MLKWHCCSILIAPLFAAERHNDSVHSAYRWQQKDNIFLSTCNKTHPLSKSWITLILPARFFAQERKEGRIREEETARRLRKTACLDMEEGNKEGICHRRYLHLKPYDIPHLVSIYSLFIYLFIYFRQLCLTLQSCLLNITNHKHNLVINITRLNHLLTKQGWCCEWFN